jgi:hypothetical protein
MRRSERIDFLRLAYVTFLAVAERKAEEKESFFSYWLT